MCLALLGRIVTIFEEENLGLRAVATYISRASAKKSAWTTYLKLASEITFLFT